MAPSVIENEWSDLDVNRMLEYVEALKLLPEMRKLYGSK